jgi:uncharacterized membrane protein
MNADPIVEAIARSRVDQRAAAARLPEPRVTGDVALASGRHIGINIPADLSDAELLEFVATLTTQIRANIHAGRARDPRSRILVPG